MSHVLHNPNKFAGWFKLTHLTSHMVLALDLNNPVVTMFFSFDFERIIQSIYRYIREQKWKGEHEKTC